MMLLSIFWSCNNKKANNDKPIKNKQNISNNLKNVEIFEGILPCSDCDKITITLKLYHDYNDKNEPNLYTLTESHGAKNKKSHSGAFNYERGYGDDNDATVIVLDYKKTANEQQYFVRYSKDNTSLYKLNTNKKIINSAVLYKK